VRSYAATLWLLSAGLAALIFVALPKSMLVYFVIATVVIETSHQLSPIALAWSNDGFRKIMLVRPVQYMMVPALAFALAITLPIWCVSPVSLTWNAYHYGMQNFGVLSFWKRPKHRWLAIAACLLTMSVPMLLVAYLQLSWSWLFVVVAATSFNHWVVDIGLSWRASRQRWLFLGGILLVGLVGFVWYEPTSHGFHRRSDELLQVAMAVGFVHFLYSRWVWNMSNPKVRATIGADLFREAGQACPGDGRVLTQGVSH
jgi:hypothetical protein